ncbi:dual OB domain-containing protein [Geminocystis herdmanii]|uniref:dual OB domain-containing protein n=1 Tax=Geminocystis herdmanii TaxID=669359 RepID=UPI00034AC103|nr:hypothetical protein [Geminocystis herdmanii]
MKIICLANSYKHHGRCIAGININSGEWIRPVSSLEDGKLPIDDSYLKVDRIWLLDIIDIPIDRSQKLGYEVENYGYYHLPWQITDKAKVIDLLSYCEDTLLYPEFDRAIPYEYLRQQSPLRTLQLIEVKSLWCYKDERNKGKGRILDEKYNIASIEISVTDPLILKKLDYQESYTCHGLICLSLSQPWQKSPQDELMCYRLIAGIIELPSQLEKILTQMERVGWSQSQGRKYLRENFDKESRYQLTLIEAQQFLTYLENLSISR